MRSPSFRLLIVLALVWCFSACQRSVDPVQANSDPIPAPRQAAAAQSSTEIDTEKLFILFNGDDIIPETLRQRSNELDFMPNSLSRVRYSDVPGGGGWLRFLFDPELAENNLEAPILYFDEISFYFAESGTD